MPYLLERNVGRPQSRNRFVRSARVSAARRLSVVMLLASFFLASSSRGQTPPEIGYIFPPCATPGSAVEVKLGGYNWTPDMQLVTRDQALKIELTGPPSEVIVPPPPFWFGKKARDNDLPLPREFPARITIAADAKPGLVKWQAANANGATATGVFMISDPEKTELIASESTTEISALPVAVIGQIQKLEEIDRFSWLATKSGVVSMELWSRRLGSQLNAIIEVRDSSGKIIADAADPGGHDLQLTFSAEAGERYTICLYDIDFRGHGSFVYRLEIREGGQIVATVPAVIQRGSTAKVEFLGYGLQSNTNEFGTVTREVACPKNDSDASSSVLDYQFDSVAGSPLQVSLPTSDCPELIEGEVATKTAPHEQLPVGITGRFDTPFVEDRYCFKGLKGAVWSVVGESMKRGNPLDLAIAIYAADGKELARNDDAPQSLDAALEVTLPADGLYEIGVADLSGQTGRRDAIYRLHVDTATPRFALSAPDHLAVTLGGTAKLPIKVDRRAGQTAPIELQLLGLPQGVTAPSQLVIPAGAKDFTVELQCSENAAVEAKLVQLRGVSKANDVEVSFEMPPVLLAVVMKPRTKITPEGLDDVRKWPRGSTYLAPVLIERLEGYTGEVILEQTAHQQRVRQGISGPDFIVEPGATRVEYPVFLPEWLETTKTSRIILNGVCKVPDPQGKVRHLLNKMELRIGMLPVGALLKVSASETDHSTPVNEPFALPVEVTRSADLTEPVMVEAILPDSLASHVSVEPVRVEPSQASVALQLKPVGMGPPIGEATIVVRATALRDGRWPVVSETTCLVEFLSPMGGR